jgi:LCP family protein required for cell wall assembly
MMALNWRSPVARALRRGERINGLLIGSDYEDRTRHSDTLMFVSYDPQTRFLDVLSIPRDTQVRIPGLPRVTRINEIFAYEFLRSHKDFGAASIAEKNYIETLLSSGTVHPVVLPYYVTLDYGGFRSLIDALGGIYVRVTEPMNYDDNWGHLHIHFKPGTYLMNGHDALTYVRYRGSSADAGRILRQQIFVKEVLKRLKNPALLWRLPHYAAIALSGIHTNFSGWDLVTIIMEGRRLHWTDMRLFSLPGKVFGNLWVADLEKTRKIVAMMQAPAPRGTPRDVMRRGKEFRGAMVEVWNASSRPNVAREVMYLLRQNGFDVVVFGNFSTRQQRTLVIDRSGNLRPAQAVALVLRAANPEVVSRPEPSRQVDVSVILGNDYPSESGPRWRL